MAVSVLACLAMTGCTHNDGDIGEWFGEWHLQSIEIDGAADADYDGDVLWKFQNNIVDMVMSKRTDIRARSISAHGPPTTVGLHSTSRIPTTSMLRAPESMPRRRRRCCHRE